MNYLNKLDSDDLDYLMQHKEGSKCWQTDYKLLRELHGAIAKANFKSDREIREAITTSQKEQKNLFSESELVQ